MPKLTRLIGGDRDENSGAIGWPPVSLAHQLYLTRTSRRVFPRATPLTIISKREIAVERVNARLLSQSFSLSMSAAGRMQIAGLCRRSCRGGMLGEPVAGAIRDAAFKFFMCSFTCFHDNTTT